MFNTIGKKVQRIDGYEKVTGKVIYGDDIKIHGMLFAAFRYTDIPCGKIKKIDISDAEKMEGVESIVLFKDIPGAKRVGPIRQDYYPIVNDEVFFSGDVVAVVAAKTKEIALLAVEKIEIEYEPIEPVTNIEKAVKPDSRFVHPEY
ncbi:MAG: aldehyde oxidase, partial [Candidatus Cloacimonetes bacterium]|nr:aldehyde oxidase [Candidatus Cloacimonadota bacterium]